MRVWSRLEEALGRFGNAAMVTVASAEGSTPREAGARLIVFPDGQFVGTIGGGTLEWRAIALAQAALAADRAQPATYRTFSLGPELGQCCGGRVTLLVEMFGSMDRQAVSNLAAREAAGTFAVEAEVGDDGHVVRRSASETIPPGSAVLRHGRLLEGFGDSRRPILLFGAGHVGRALVLAMAPLPFSVTWVDSRPEAFPALLPANVKAHQVDDPPAAIAAASAHAFVLVMSHGHQLDLALVHAALADGRFPYVGLIGSATKRARFAKRLREAGIGQERIDALVCPIGGGAIRSKDPAVIAAATVAELLIRNEAVPMRREPEMVLMSGRQAG